MAISPIVLNGTITASQNVSAYKAHDDSKAAILQSNTHTKIEHQIEKKLSRVREQDDTEMKHKGFDAREKGSNEYEGDGGKHRHTEYKGEDGAVYVKEKGGFDISI